MLNILNINSIYRLKMCNITLVTLVTTPIVNLSKDDKEGS